MKTRHKYKSEAFAAVHSTVAGMHKAGTVDKQTMRSFDESCLTVPESIEPTQIDINSKKPAGKPANTR